MEAPHSALYAGKVVHHRLRPRHHTLRYRIFQLLLDLDEIDMLDRSLLLFSRNRPNLFSFYDRDHGRSGCATPLRAQVEDHLQNAGIEGGGPIRLLTMPRILGYAFNPLSVYFCHRRDGSLSAILYEVNNTFGQRHHYLIPVAPGSETPIRQESRKSLYVSPFLGTEMTYLFTVVPPRKRLAVSVTGSDTEGAVIVARLVAARRELSDTALAHALLRYPLLTFKVTAGIHWEALVLWLKKVGLHHRPAPPNQSVTIGQQAAADGAPNMNSTTSSTVKAA